MRVKDREQQTSSDEQITAFKEKLCGRTTLSIDDLCDVLKTSRRGSPNARHLSTTVNHG